MNGTPPGRAGNARQHFYFPEGLPFLEIRTTHDSALPYAEHLHAAVSVGLILAGETRTTVGGERHTVSEGDIVLIAPGLAHSCNPVDGRTRGYHMLFIDEPWLREQAGCPPPGTVWRARETVVKDAARHARLAALVDTVCRENGRDGGPCRELAACLADLLTSHGGFLPLPVPKYAGNLPPLRFAADPAFLEADGERPVSVSGLAKNAGLRRDSFSRAVRRTVGLPPNAYLHCLRLEKGRRLLRQGKSVTEAALASGYADQSHFHRMFVRFFSITPGCYRGKRSQPYKK